MFPTKCQVRMVRCAGIDPPATHDCCAIFLGPPELQKFLKLEQFRSRPSWHPGDNQKFENRCNTGFDSLTLETCHCGTASLVAGEPTSRSIRVKASWRSRPAVMLFIGRARARCVTLIPGAWADVRRDNRSA